ncbi:MAG: hypothetical protein ABIA63_07060, partial [bacterium]
MPMIKESSAQTLVVNGWEGTRGVEEHPGVIKYHSINLFLCRRNPKMPGLSWNEFVDYVKNPSHSFVDDGEGGIIILTHPYLYNQKEFIKFTNTIDLTKITGIDITHCQSGPIVEQLWDRLLIKCYDENRVFLWGFGCDDHEHFLSWTWALMDTLSEAALKQAFINGAFYASSGVIINDICVKKGKITLNMPEETIVIWLTSNNRELKRDINVKKTDYTLNDSDRTTIPDKSRFIRALLYRKGCYAWTNPFRIILSDSLENPYGKGGKWYKSTTHNHSDLAAGKRKNFEKLFQDYADSGYTAAFHTPYGYWHQKEYQFPLGKRPLINGLLPDR